jgi:two-component system, LytTR family, sensor kinase
MLRSINGSFEMSYFAMESTRTAKQFWLRWMLIAAGWLTFALFFASQVIVGRAYSGRPANIKGALFPWLICATLWLAATPLILWLSRRFPLDRRRWLTNSVVHLAIGAFLSFLLLAAYTSIISLLHLGNSNQTWLGAFRFQIVGGFHAEVLTYWMVIGLCHGIDYYRKYRERELRASQLEARLAQAQLDALKMQLHPHFLFNTLNSISVLMSEDVVAARRMLARLGDLLRASLENVGTHEVSLREELEFLNNYLGIEQTRFQDRLSVKIDVEASVLNSRVPNLILQPLVENAIRHGIAPHTQPGLVEIRAARKNGMVELQVRDNGAGLPKGSPGTLMKGIGLSNTEARLKQLYGAHHRFDISEVSGGGLLVAIAIPFNEGSAPPKVV